MIFTDKEIEYLRGQSLGRLATVSSKGIPQVRPVSFQLNDDGTIDVGGPSHSSSLRWRTLESNPELAFVVDDMPPDEPGAVKPGWGRGIEIRGRAELLTDHAPPAFGDGFFSNEVIR